VTHQTAEAITKPGIVQISQPPTCSVNGASATGLIPSADCAHGAVVDGKHTCRRKSKTLRFLVTASTPSAHGLKNREKAD
jgi:hypothetical protein